MKKLFLTAIAAFCLSVPSAQAADSSHIELPDMQWSFDGPFGTYDRGALQRGFQVYKQVCSACHSMDHLAYRNLSALGYNDDEVKAIAADYSTMDGPDDEGEMFERPMKPSDRFKNPYANEKQARYANNGALPPDMSLIAKARVGGANYLYGLLTGYEEPPEGFEIGQGQHYNAVMAGHKIAMANPLSDDIVAYEDGSPTTVDQYAKDVSHFLMWAAEPKMEDRKRMGVMVILFLLAFTGIMYKVKKKIWADLKR